MFALIAVAIVVAFWADHLVAAKSRARLVGRALLVAATLASLCGPAIAGKPKRNAWFAEPARVSPMSAYWRVFNGAAKSVEGRPVEGRTQGRTARKSRATKSAKAQDIEPAEFGPIGPATIINPFVR